MSRTDDSSRPRVDVRSRPIGVAAPVDPATFWSGEWREAIARNGARAAADAERLGLAPLAIRVGDDVWTLRRGESSVEVVPGRDPTTLQVALDLDQRFRLDDRPAEAAHFLAEAGFLLVQDVFTDDEVRAVDADFARAVDAASPVDGASWWAATGAGVRYPCRMLDFARKSPTLRDLLSDPRFLAIGALLGDGHRPGDPFGEHFAAVTAEGLVKRVDSVEGLVCLPWHKDCERGGHSRFCSGLTVGICLTPADEAHGGLDVVAGTHRANISRVQVDTGLDLPRVTLRADRGDLTVHTSCTVHRSTQPVSCERRVVYTGFALPPRPGDHHDDEAQPRLRRERAAIGHANTSALLGAEIQPGRPAR